MLVTITIIGIVSMVVVPQLIMAWDRSRQRKSVGEMRNLSTALSTYQVDHGQFPVGGGLADLVPDYYGVLPTTGWQDPFYYLGVGSGCAYILIGQGSDSAFGPAAPDPWVGDVPEPDIVLVTGSFLQAPGLSVRIDELAAVIASTCS